jgi:type II secretory pathway pseudopilin PulG
MRNPAAFTPAFTVVELLTTVIIMTLLIGIVMPVIGKVRSSAYDASTRSEVQQIAAACDRYFDDFRAYPGPVSNSDIESQFFSNSGSLQSPLTDPSSGSRINIYSSALSSTTSSTLITATIAGGPPATFFTASQNLVLGLLGGLWIDPVSGNPNYGKVEFLNGPVTGATATSLIGAGPQTLIISTYNPATFRQYASYLQTTFPGSPLLTNGDGSPETALSPFHDAGQRTFYDCPIPVFTDAFPDHMPILYVRARVGAPGVISGPSGIGNNGVSVTVTAMVKNPLVYPQTDPQDYAHYNYDLLELIPYTCARCGVPLNSTALPIFTGYHALQSVGNSGQDIEPDFAAFAPNSPELAKYHWDHPVPDEIDNAGQYFINPAITPTNMSTAQYENLTGTPRNKDTYILISAGRDRTYGTGDDVTNFGDVGQ